MRAAFVDVNGTRMRYLYEGLDRPGVPLVLLHGFFESAQSYARSIDVLASDRPVFAFDMIGHGFSQPVELHGGAPQGPALAATLALIDHLGMKRFDIAGASFGGSIAALVYFERPEAVRKVVISGSATTFDTSEQVSRMTGGAITHLLPIVRDASIASLRKMMLDAAGVETADVETILPGMLTTMAMPGISDFMAAALTGMSNKDAIAEYSVLERLQSFNAPTLVLWGRNDSRPWQLAADGVARMPNAQLTIVEKCGHLLHVGAPERFNSLVLDFLNRPGG